MKTVYSSLQPKTAFNFRRWSRKGFAVFASLGKLVRIATLKTVVSDTLSRKDGVSQLDAFLAVGIEDDEAESDPDLIEIQNVELLSAQIQGNTLVLANAVGAHAPLVRDSYLNPIDLGLWGFLLLKRKVPEGERDKVPKYLITKGTKWQRNKVPKGRRREVPECLSA